MQYETVHDRDTSYYRTHGVPPSASTTASGNEDTNAGWNEDKKDSRDASRWKEKERWERAQQREEEDMEN